MRSTSKRPSTVSLHSPMGSPRSVSTANNSVVLESHAKCFRRMPAHHHAGGAFAWLWRHPWHRITVTETRTVVFFCLECHESDVTGSPDHKISVITEMKRYYWLKMNTKSFLRALPRRSVTPSAFHHAVQPVRSHEVLLLGPRTHDLQAAAPPSRLHSPHACIGGGDNTSGWARHACATTLIKGISPPPWLRGLCNLITCTPACSLRLPSSACFCNLSD
jgi:hypothetical protein